MRACAEWTHTCAPASMVPAVRKCSKRGVQPAEVPQGNTRQGHMAAVWQSAVPAPLSRPRHWLVALRKSLMCHLARLWCPVVWSNPSAGVAVEPSGGCGGHPTQCAEHRGGQWVGLTSKLSAGPGGAWSSVLRGGRPVGFQKQNDLLVHLVGAAVPSSARLLNFSGSLNPGVRTRSCGTQKPNLGIFKLRPPRKLLL